MAANPKGDIVPELYPGETAVIIATGPSLTYEQLDYIRPFAEAGAVRIFGCNDVYKWCDFLDVFYFCDPRWYEVNNRDDVKPFPVSRYKCAQIWTQDAKAGPKYGINRVLGSGGKGLCKTENKIHFGSNSGFQLINLAWHFGIRKFLLIGYNMDVPKGMQQHMFGPHPKPLNRAHNYKGFIASYRQIEAKDRALITNCTYPTGLDCFVKQPLGDALPRSLLDGKQIHPRRREHGSREPDQSSAEVAAVPTASDRTEVAGTNGSPSRDRTEPAPTATRSVAQATYGGPR